MPQRAALEIFAHPALSGLHVVRGAGVTADIARHAHRKLLVGLCLSGGRSIVSADGERRVGEGQGFIIAPGVVHACRPAGTTGHAYLVLAVDPALLADAGPGPASPPPEPRAFDDRNAAALLIALDEAVSLGRENALPLLLALARRLDIRAAPPPRPHPATLLAMAAIDAAPQEAHTLAGLSRLAGVSPFHLERLFLRDLGVPIGEYALARRVALAAARIEAGEPLAEAALAAGFYDQSHLTRHFRRRMGVTPGSYGPRPGPKRRQAASAGNDELQGARRDFTFAP